LRRRSSHMWAREMSDEALPQSPAARPAINIRAARQLTAKSMHVRNDHVATKNQ